MKPRLLITLSFVFLSYSAFSQNYKPFLTPGKAWTEIATEFVDGFCMSIFLNEPDTIAGIGVAYKITEFFGDESWLIEDTDAKKVWYYKENSSMTSPELLYDFSLNVGDTTHIITGVNSGVSTTRFVVTEINSGLWGRRMHVRDIDNQTNNIQNIWIEGVGAIEGGLLHSISLLFSPRISKVRQGFRLLYDANLNTNNTDFCYEPTEDYISMLQGNPTWEERIVDFGGEIYCNDFSLIGPQMLDSLMAYRTVGNYNRLV